MWNDSNDILEDVQDTLTRLRAKEIDPDDAHAETRLLNTAVKMLAVQLEHARLTGRFHAGDDAMPTFRMGAGKAQKQLKEAG